MLFKKKKKKPCFNREVLVELSDHAATMMSELDGMSKESDRQLTFEQWIQSVDHLEIDLMNAIKVIIQFLSQIF